MNQKQHVISWLRWHLPVAACLFFLLACTTSKPVASTKPAPYGPAEIERQIEASERMKQRFVGFALYDPELDSMIVAHHADKYFVPASNTKLYTFYASLKMLGDSIPALKYAVHGDSLLFWGTGDPMFTHMDVKNSLAYDFLKNRPEKLYYIDGPFASTPFATNWGWDDYNYYYQPERNVFPIHGNIVKFTRKDGGPYTVTPAYFKPLIKTDSTQNDNEDPFVRAWRSNDITYYPKYAKPNFSVEVPFITSPEMTAALLADTLKRPVKWVKRSIPADAQTFYGLPADTVYKRMLQVSDNLLAEQLMALSSGTISDTLSVKRGIKYALEHYLADLPDTPVWVDGSGLSTMDLFTPRDMIAILQKLLQERPKERLFPLLAAGGRPGTFRNIYKADVPFVFAKSGTLSHVHNQSGYLITKSGKLLLYSFMNNNFSVPTSEIRNEMERIVTDIHNRY
ncbi:D-alanyl-D-alanine carboxypeptidase/D-alanyl-D-alanine-endopeptidase [Pontibacter chitinilyticus]|uniref:D-alanyl-D-alanine carboxypeptidase/D-alanyl-D-alanine-endopeptidase n=1 Tax=Pontibacter chitinilyticus TaxID=2674989 RepID=UPI00321B0C24